MRLPVIALWRDFWKTPDPALLGAGAGGEALVSQTRLVLTGLVLLIPARLLVPWPPDREVFVGLAAAGCGFVAALAAYWYGRRRLYRPWLGFATSLTDVTLVSFALAVFLALGRPHTAVNSKVVFEIYFLALAATTLRFDPRICVMTGLAAVAQYGGIIAYAATRTDLNDPRFAPFPYGMFSWDAQVSRLILLAVAAGVSTLVVERSRRLQWLSARDRLTGLLNRGVFDDLLPLEAARATRAGRPLSIIMIDVDHFKQFNDTHGHQRGDAVLCMVGSTVRQALRERELVARFGGDEFVVLLPATPSDVATDRAEAIQRAVAVAPLVVTVSVGAATFPMDGTDIRDVLAQADGRLYQVKQTGRNRVLGPSTLLEGSASIVFRP